MTAPRPYAVRVPSARKAGDRFKAIVVHHGYRQRTEVVGKRGYHGIGITFATRDEAVAYATNWIAVTDRHRAVADYRFNEAHRTGIRPTVEEARAALGHATGEN
jgi:hypothetical protein|tara:strand:+ start:638 stop:949 length:312 start_codon:yes stop_codon:yes gene_type:complete